MVATSRPPFPIAPLTADERPAFARLTALAFGETLDDDAVAHIVASELDDPSRSLAARDGDRIVGTTTALDYTMSVPGGAPVDCAGITAVAVAPTHRRRGVLGALMRRQLDDLHAAGTAWAALYASEAVIYGRYGYGVASRSASFRLDGPWTHFAVPTDPPRLELLDPADAAPRLARIYDRIRDDVPGMMSMPEPQMRLFLEHDPPNNRGGASQRHLAALDDRGFVAYRVRQGWDDAGPDGTVVVQRCMATDPDAWRQLWSYLLNLDLMQHLEAHQRPVDDPLPWWLAERRRLRVSDGMPCYLRLVDVGAALSQRGTTGSGDVVVDVDDPFCQWNTRHWRIAADGDRLRCEPTTDAADVAMDARELASLSLGGVSPFELARADLLDERRDGALRRLHGLLASHRPPWNPFVF